jgi:NADPH:quinone reductase-like Zn-dependent oxidoreductase
MTTEELFMKAVRVHEKGGPEVLTYEDVPEPRPRSGEILIRVKAVGVNFADHLMRIGAYHSGPMPIIPGLEAAGTIVELGADVDSTRFAVGQDVIAWTHDSYAQLAVAPAWAVLPMPRGLTHQQAAAIPVAFGTAWHALVRKANLQPGERVLVHAVGSGVGSAALQFAKALGAWVVATAGQDWKLDRARAMGADATIDYSTQDVLAEVRRLTEGAGVDVVLEGVGKATFAASVGSLADNGRCVIYGAPSGPRVELDTRLAIARNLSLYGMSVTTSAHFPRTASDFEARALPWFADGTLKPVIDHVFPLRDAAQAHQRMMDRALFGKLILSVE